MHKFKRSRPRITLLESDQPPTPTPIDTKIAHNNGTSVAIEATKESLQASKTVPTPSLSEIIDQRTRENGRLRHELAYQQRKQAIDLSTLEKVGRVVAELRHTLREHKRLEAVIDHDFGKIDTSEEVE
ncbi:hypothetical protein BKA64DRAFT_763401 [Cadophora sp. MPI-SDFR-AT-0126]|nr:hypothetical protein BKA64DRAFT_763401 [Leotiomycetes sp. MPI-SDFR-AT-0126]